MINLIEDISDELTKGTSLKKTIIFDIYRAKHDCSLDHVLEAIDMITNLKVCYVGPGFNNYCDRYNLIKRVQIKPVEAKIYLSKKALKLKSKKNYCLNKLDILTKI